MATKRTRGIKRFYVWRDRYDEDYSASVVKPTWDACDECGQPTCPHGGFTTSVNIDVCDEIGKRLFGTIPEGTFKTFEISEVK